MSRLVSFLSALWLSSATAQPGFVDIFTNTATGAKSVADGIRIVATNEVQAGIAPAGEGAAFLLDGVCNHVKQLVRVEYENYKNGEPDMSKLTLVYMDKFKTVIYNLTQAPTEFPKERWFDPECRLLIFFHGFTDDPSKSSFQTIREAAEKGLGKCVSILALDASSLIKSFYLRASTVVIFIGRIVGEILAALLPVGLTPEKIHLIGHSLGSHIAGNAGKQYFQKTGRKVGRISGLDPAGPCFGKLDPELKLQKDDAVFVDVIHSDAGTFGLKEQIGHVDFRPNGGSEQPNCLVQTCSHSRSWGLYSDSIKYPDSFPAVKCNDYYAFRHGECDINDTSYMGYFTSPNVTGNYYLMTAGESPYGAGAVGMTYSPNGIVRGISFLAKDTFRSFG